MNIMMENIITGIVKPLVGLTNKEQKIETQLVRQSEQTHPIQYEEGTIPIGLGVIPLIPTGSVFIPRELVLPKEEKPLEVEIVDSNKQELLPQELGENNTKVQKLDKSDIQQKAETTPTAVGKENQSIDILV